jgi:uncharacterized membrane protein
MAVSSKHKALVTTGCVLAGCVLFCILAWSKAGSAKGALGTFLGALAVIFAICAVIAVAALVIISNSSHAQMDNRRKKKRGAAGAAAVEAASFDFVEPTPAAAPRKPRPAAKPAGGDAPPVKSPRPAVRKSRD